MKRAVFNLLMILILVIVIFVMFFYFYSPIFTSIWTKFMAFSEKYYIYANQTAQNLTIFKGNVTQGISEMVEAQKTSFNLWTGFIKIAPYLFIIIVIIALGIWARKWSETGTIGFGGIQ